MLCKNADFNYLCRLDLYQIHETTGIGKIRHYFGKIYVNLALGMGPINGPKFDLKKHC